MMKLSTIATTVSLALAVWGLAFYGLYAFFYWK
jgi:hypothetical protein